MAFFWIFFVLVLLFGFVVFRGAPYVPSRKKLIRKAFTELYSLSDKDVLLDVGSGDGIVLRVAGEYGAKAVGFELNPLLALISDLLTIGKKNISIKLADFWRSSIPDDTTVVYVFMVEHMETKMTKKIQSEANRINRTLTIIAYGIPFSRLIPDKTLGAYFLYHIEPLQSL